jgi:hypothetical protein
MRPRGLSDLLVPAPGRTSSACGSHAKLSRLRVVDMHTCVQRAQGHEPENW